jgi:hypothetical protein
MRFHRVRECHCRVVPCICEKWEAELRKSGHDHLEYEDGLGNVLLGNRGAGKLADTGAADSRAEAEAAATATLAKRAVLLQRATFGVRPARGPGGIRPAASHANRRRDRAIWELYAAGAGTKHIARALRMSRALVRRRIAEIWRVHGHLAAPVGLAALARECEASTVVLVFTLLRRAIERPAEVEEMLRAAEREPELRAMLEVDR